MPKRARDEQDNGPEKRRRRRQPGSAPAASGLGGVVAFNDVWAWLRNAGWSSKPPPRRSLDPRYRYIRPGGDANGQEGVDFLLGESAVLQYAASANAFTTVSTNSGDGDECDDVIQAREQAAAEDDRGQERG
ncbi:hypothetical protein PR001_g31468, partial [Phytophthora rubi]